MKKPLVSIIVPVYNIEQYVLRCLKSLTEQGYRNLEIIVVDDGSMDKSGTFCDEFAKVDERVKVYHLKNGGLSNARNYGVKKANGDIIAFVDGDDSVDANYISVMVDEMNRSDADIVICGYNDVVPEAIVMNGEDATIKLLTRQENLEIVAWNKLYRKSLFVDNSIWYPVGEKNEDSLTTYKLLEAAAKVAYVDKSLYHYMIREGSIMNKVKMEERLKMREKAAREAVEYFGDGGLRRAAEVAVLLAKYAFMDAAIRGEVATKYFDEAQKWIVKHKKEYDGNQYMTRRLAIYNSLCGFGDGFLYKIFRKIKHE